MDAFEVDEVNPAAISDSPHLLIVLFVCVRKGDLVVKVKDSANSEVGKSLFEEAWYFLRNGLLDLLLDVVPQLMDEYLQVILQQNSLRQTHLIHGAVNMQHLHEIAALSDVMQFSILVLLLKSGLSRPDRLVVDVVLTWFAVAVSAEHGLEGKKG